MSDNAKLEKLVLGLYDQFTEMKTEMNARFDAVDVRFDRLEDNISDVRDEMRAEGAATRTLVHQAFEHITSLQVQNAHPFSFETGHRPYPRSTSGRK